MTARSIARIAWASLAGTAAVLVVVLPGMAL